MEQLNDVLTIDRDATREAIRIKYRTPIDFAMACGFRQSTIYSILNGNSGFNADPRSVYQGILRAMRDHDVLVQETDSLKVAA